MAKKDKETARTDTVKTGVFKKMVRVPIDAEETQQKELKATKIQLQIRKLQKKILPEKQQITKLRTDHKELMEDIETETSEMSAEVYEVKKFRSGEAIIFLAETDKEVGRRTLEKTDYQADVEESAAE
jgi:hypothetical protein